ncbi:MAG: hypothetical protein M0026_11075 [Nocardiopsaceae bacterium]|nr:hypothetical protein [Nocardiopsaceae bacterium]
MDYASRTFLLQVYDKACTTACRHCPCPLPPGTVRCRLCGRLQEETAEPDRGSAVSPSANEGVKEDIGGRVRT